MDRTYDHITELDNELGSERKIRIFDFLNQNPVGVLSTVDEELGVEGVVIYFAIDSHFEITFITRTETRKHHNLKRDTRVMLTVFDAISQTTSQVTGNAIEISDDYEINQVAGAILRQAVKVSPRAALPLTKLKAGPYTAYRIRPTQIRMAMYSRPDPGNYESIFESIESFELN